jgi:predicted  nucleic acid-binding Zn-ribbon protein
VNEQLQLLVALQKIDTTILTARREVDLLPLRLTERQEALKKAEARYAQAVQNADDVLQKRHVKEREISEAKDRLEKLQRRSSEIKKNTEYQAHLAELQRVESEIQLLETSLRALAEEVNRANQEVTEAQREVSLENEGLELMRNDLSAEAVKREVEIRRLKGERKKIVARLDPDINDHYMLLMRACRGFAVAEVKDEVCQGCYIHIPPQLYVEVKTGEGIETCPQCRRILYYVRPTLDE